MLYPREYDMITKTVLSWALTAVRSSRRCWSDGAKIKVKINSFRNKITSVRRLHPWGTGKEVEKEGDDGCAWGREPHNQEKDSLLPAVRPAWPQIYKGLVLNVYGVCCPHATSGVWDEICAGLPDPHILSPRLLEQGHISVRATLIWVAVFLQPVCVALSYCYVMLNLDSGRSRAVTLLGTEFPCRALKVSAKQPSQLSLLHVTHGIHRARWSWKEIFFIKPQQICPLGAACIHFGVCKGECKPCAVVRVLSGSADVPHLSVRLIYRALRYVCDWLQVCSAGIFLSRPV